MSSQDFDVNFNHQPILPLPPDLLQGDCEQQSGWSTTGSPPEIPSSSQDHDYSKPVEHDVTVDSRRQSEKAEEALWKWKCLFCGKFYATKNSAYVHTYTHGKHYRSVKGLKVGDDDSVKCGICSEKMPMKRWASMISHIRFRHRNFTEQNWLQCETCHRCEPDEFRLKRHLMFRRECNQNQEAKIRASRLMIKSNILLPPVDMDLDLNDFQLPWLFPAG